jgi:hypothetical protein
VLIRLLIIELCAYQHAQREQSRRLRVALPLLVHIEGHSNKCSYGGRWYLRVN